MDETLEPCRSTGLSSTISSFIILFEELRCPKLLVWHIGIQEWASEARQQRGCGRVELFDGRCKAIERYPVGIFIGDRPDLSFDITIPILTSEIGKQFDVTSP